MSGRNCCDGDARYRRDTAKPSRRHSTRRRKYSASSPGTWHTASDIWKGEGWDGTTSRNSPRTLPVHRSWGRRPRESPLRLASRLCSGKRAVLPRGAASKAARRHAPSVPDLGRYPHLRRETLAWSGGYRHCGIPLPALQRCWGRERTRRRSQPVARDHSCHSRGGTTIPTPGERTKSHCSRVLRNHTRRPFRKRVSCALGLHIRCRSWRPSPEKPTVDRGRLR